MGKITGFLEFERVDRTYKAVEERVKHWNEFVVPLSEKETKTQAARCMDCGIPYCHSGCPVNNQIPDWNDLVYRGDWKGAIENLHSTNNFPEVTGRICPAPCEAACTLNIEDNPVSIKTIECAIADRGFEEGWIVPQKSGKQDRKDGRGGRLRTRRAGCGAATGAGGTRGEYLREECAAGRTAHLRHSRTSRWRRQLSRGA